MSVNSIIINALSEFDYPVKPDIYTGKEKRYITFNYADDRGMGFADDEPDCILADMQIHFFLPLEENGKAVNYLSDRRKIREALFKAGFTYPSIVNLVETDNNIRHLVFECQTTEER